MTQYQDPFAQPFGDPSMQPKKTSGLAVTALVFSLIFFCPVTTILAPILGAIALATIGSNPARKGKGMALTAIILGVVFTAGQYFVGKKVWDLGYGYYQFVMSGPNEALTAGFAGNIAAFKSSFHGAGATAPDAEANDFIQQLRTRYGTFASAAFNEKTGKPPTGQPGQPNVPFPYVLRFANKTVNAETELVFADQSTGTMLQKLGYIHVFDPDAGDIVYPQGAASSGRSGGSTSGGGRSPASSGSPPPATKPATGNGG